MNSITSKDSENQEVFVLIMMDKADFEVTAHLPLSSSRPPDESITNSYDRSNKQEHKTDGG